MAAVCDSHEMTRCSFNLPPGNDIRAEGARAFIMTLEHPNCKLHTLDLSCMWVVWGGLTFFFQRGSDSVKISSARDFFQSLTSMWAHPSIAGLFFHSSVFN